VRRVVETPKRARQNGHPENGHRPIRDGIPRAILDLPRRVDPKDKRKTVERLWTSYRKSTTDAARNRLVEAYQGLVREVVRRFAYRLPKSVERGDLDTAANFGLISAIEGFDPSRGVRFESYCELRVKGALLDELRNQDWLPRPWRTRIELHKRVTERLRAEQNREPADEDIAVEMGMPLEEYRQVFGVGLPGAPLGSMPSEESGEESVPGLEILEDLHGDAPGERLTRDEILKLVTQRLSVQEYRIVYLKYWEELSMREIGEIMRLSESRVCKVHARLLERLKDRFRAGSRDA
jgi:RNA polymerase sigma factor for flagellar operon FliA